VRARHAAIGPTVLPCPFVRKCGRLGGEVRVDSDAACEARQ